MHKLTTFKFFNEEISIALLAGLSDFLMKILISVVNAEWMVFAFTIALARQKTSAVCFVKCSLMMIFAMLLTYLSDFLALYTASRELTSVASQSLTYVTVLLNKAFLFTFLSFIVVANGTWRTSLKSDGAALENESTLEYDIQD